jgi:hypothetical protein
VDAAERKQRPDFKVQRPARAAAAEQGVGEHDGVLAADEAELFFHRPPVALVGPAGEGLGAEGAEVLVPVGPDDAGVLVAGEVKLAAVDEDHLLDARQQHHPPHRRRHRRDQQAVVPACVEAGDGGRRVPAQRVGHEPLARDQRVKIVLPKGDR